jgi:hypothetical protein
MVLSTRLRRVTSLGPGRPAGPPRWRWSCSRIQAPALALAAPGGSVLTNARICAVYLAARATLARIRPCSGKLQRPTRLLRHRAHPHPRVTDKTSGHPLRGIPEQYPLESSRQTVRSDSSRTGSCSDVWLMTRNGNQVRALALVYASANRCRHDDQRFRCSSVGVGLPGLEPGTSSSSAKCR